MKQLQDSSFSSVEEKSFDENSSQELSLESLSEISAGVSTTTKARKGLVKTYLKTPAPGEERWTPRAY